VVLRAWWSLTLPPSSRVTMTASSSSIELDLQTADALGELADALRRDGIELRLAAVHAPALEVLTRSGVAQRVRIEAALDDAVRDQPSDA
jgi:hypothetical protein